MTTVFYFYLCINGVWGWRIYIIIFVIIITFYENSLFIRGNCRNALQFLVGHRSLFWALGSQGRAARQPLIFVPFLFPENRLKISWLIARRAPEEGIGQTASRNRRLSNQTGATSSHFLPTNFLFSVWLSCRLLRALGTPSFSWILLSCAYKLRSLLLASKLPSHVKATSSLVFLSARLVLLEPVIHSYECSIMSCICLLKR